MQDQITGGNPIPAEFIVEVNAKPQRVVVEFATFDDLSFVEKWREALGTNPESIQREAADLAKLAKDRYLADSGVGQLYISTASDVRGHIARDPECEVGGFIVLKCDWFPASETIGLCHFRRTWCNNIVVDYLAKHPLTLGTKDDRHQVKGIGPALLCFLARIAVEHSCGLLWGEATHSSWPFYKKFFTLDEVKDLFEVSPEKIAACAERKLDWQSKKEVNTMNMDAVHELYEIEEAHPPLVGNRAVMAGSRRQLIDHFLGLSREEQNEIAAALELFREGDNDILEDQWCGVLFQRANQSGKMRELWDEVEKRHENGEPEKNPFIR